MSNVLARVKVHTVLRLTDEEREAISGIAEPIDVCQEYTLEEETLAEIKSQVRPEVFKALEKIRDKDGGHFILE